MDGNIQKYLAFIKTVEHGSFTKAAEFLSYTQSAVSRMISDLEKEFGLTLLERGRNGLWLTSDGEKLLPAIRQLCHDYENLQIIADELTGLSSGLIRIGAFSSVATHWIPKIIKAFEKDYPGIEYEILMGNYTEIEKWVLEGKADCGFLPLPQSSPLETIELESDELLVILPENHPLRDFDKFPVDALCDYPFILPKTGEKIDVSQIFQRHNLTPNIRFTTFDDYAIMSMVESGLGISILPKLILQRAPYHILVKELDVPAYRTIGLALRNRHTASACVKAFLNYLDYR